MEVEQTTSFAPSGEDAITRTIEIAEEFGPSSVGAAFDDFYEIERTATELARGGYQRIALQFPDELLHDSVPIFRRLKQRIAEIVQSENTPTTDVTADAGSSSTIKGHPEIYVLADTSYGRCCVDEVAAQHVNADALVHYGHACMTLTSRLPVLYVFGQKLFPASVQTCTTELVRLYTEGPAASSDDSPKAVLLKHDVGFTYMADILLQSIREELIKNGPQGENLVAVLYDRVETSPRSPNPESDASAEGDVQLKHTAIFYIGGESLGLTNLLMTNSGREVYTFDPRTGRAVLASAVTNRLLMRRYATVQKARDADVFGILVGTLGVASYLPLISHIRKLLARRRKKSYTISVGKLNPAKLANFLEVECFVLIACPENSLVQGEKDFLRPIVTPYELEVAMQAEQSWTGKYVLDFGRLLADANTSNEDAEDVENSDNSDPDQPVFSLTTGKYRHAKQYGSANAADNETTRTLVGGVSALVLRNQDDQIARMDSAAGQFLQQRTYQGLDMRLGEDSPSVLEQGRSGIARGYQDDREHQNMTRTEYK
ncbi:hypothetical protein D9619_008779 [Psilocybe cf. subviscida]|uniref:2-(3-amino-3-carboxypropyl)histidine synthase subunit 2 n=1 Tax=Psilocybe cf. subviscida TaxID=2480587 RepID=A0A8H5F0X3_9AGAR|nr:hypothetical protein D9619_008779 [Psilocybe cf. subviscida]